MATDEEKQKFVADLTTKIDRELNGPELPNIPKNVGFLLLIFPMGAPPHVGCTITGNGLSREQAADLMKVQALMLVPPHQEEQKQE